LYLPGGGPITFGSLVPNPTGTTPLYDSVNSQTFAYNGWAGFGLQYKGGQLLLGATDHVFQFQPKSVQPVVFSGNFYSIGAAYTTATFTKAPSSTTLDESQMFVASSDTKGWLQIGATSPNLTYL
jgi:hypothetical protein